MRGGEVLGRRFDVTLEALAAGDLAGLRVIAFLMAFGLFSACVDPDEMLRLFRRVSYRSALTAALATRLVPVLARDALRMGDAARCRPTPPGRLAVSRAALSGALDRAVDVAAALDVRGYSVAAKPRSARRPWSRHDTRVAGAAVPFLGRSARLRVRFTYSYPGGRGPALRDVSIQLEQGTFTVLAGTSGSGKSTSCVRSAGSCPTSSVIVREAPPREFLAWATGAGGALATPVARLFSLAGLGPLPASVKEARAHLREAGLSAQHSEAEPPRGSRRRGEPVAIRTRGLWHELEDGPQVLRAVDLRLAPGERVALMGRNGARARCYPT